MKKTVTTFFVLAWAGTALAITNEPEIFFGNRNSNDDNGAEYYYEAAPDGASYLSFGEANGDLVVTYLDVARNEMMVLDLTSKASDVLKIPSHSSLPLFACLWGDGVLFCQTEVKTSGNLEDAIIAYDYNSRRSDVYSFGNRRLMHPSDGRGAALRSSFGNWLVVEEDNHSIYLLTWDGMNLSEVLVAAGAGFDYSPVVGLGGGDYPYLPGTPVHVVYQDRTPNGFVLKSWDVQKQQIVAEILVGPNEPRPSDLFGYVFLEDRNPATLVENVLVWDPSAAPENPDGPPHSPFPVREVPLFPWYHDCDSLHEMRVGSHFGLVRGEGCGLAPGKTSLFLIPRDGDRFVINYSTLAYQPFLFDEFHQLDTSRPFQYSLLGRYFAFFDDAQDRVRVFSIDTARIMPIEARRTPRDDDPMNPVALAPWNHGSKGEGSIDYAWGGRNHYWRAYLSEKQSYRIFVLSKNGPLCKATAWHEHVKMDVVALGSGPSVIGVDENLPKTPDAPLTCPVLDIQPPVSGEYTIQIYRPDPGLPGIAPPLEYTIFIEVL